MTDKQKTKGDQPLDATGEFFSVGNPLHAVRPGYVRRAADDDLYAIVSRGGYAYVVAPDRSGKSSLVAATTARLKNDGTKVAVIDLAQISERDGGVDAGRWYYNIAYRLLRQLRLKTDLQTWWQDKAMVSNRQRLVEFYIEVVLGNIQEDVVVFIDEIQCVENLPFAEHLLASIRAAHNSRATDPEFSRLTFVLLGECDPHSLVSDDGLSPFSVSKKVELADFTRDELNIFKSELNLSPDEAHQALDQIFAWTGGQPYLSQKLARSVARESVSGDIAGHVDRIALQQLAGRAALHSEPHMSHIHRAIVKDRRSSEALLNIYGKMRKGISIIYDPDSAQHRQLLAIGLVTVDSEGNLAPRNRVYATVFTAKWANENLPIHWRGPAIAAAVVLVIVAIPFWYTQLLPAPHVEVLSSTEMDLSAVADAYVSLRSFPGHRRSADNLYRSHLRMRAQSARDVADINRVVAYAGRMPDSEEFAMELAAAFWDRTTLSALRSENRDEALMAAIESLVVPSPERRQLAANLIGDDYPMLIGTVPSQSAERVLYDPENNLLSFVSGAEVSQWSMANNALQERASWTLTSLEVTPLVRRLAVERAGNVRSVSLSLGLTHARKDDLRVRLIAPSGRAVELEFDESEMQDDVVVFPGADLSDMLGEAMTGTWSLSVRDEAAAVPGSLASWSLTLNGQSYSDAPERGLDIPDPLPRESNEIWFSDGGRFAVARAIHSDSARLWDLLYAQPARTIAVPASERVLGLSGGAEYLVSAGQDSISLWRTSTGRRQAKLDLAIAGSELQLSKNGRFLSVLRRGDVESSFELWSIEEMRMLTELDIAGSPALLSLSADGSRLAIADYDRAVRIWSLGDNQQLAQIHLELQPRSISLSAGGRSLGVVHGEQGMSLWSVANPDKPVLSERGPGDWQFAFSPSGSRLIAGNSLDGFQVHRSADGAISGPPIGTELDYGTGKMLAFSSDESNLVTAGASGIARFWRAPAHRQNEASRSSAHGRWREPGVVIFAVAPGGQMLAVGDNDGHVHLLNSDADDSELANASDEISFLGHQSQVSSLRFSEDGTVVASLGRNGIVRAWDTESGLPRPFRTPTSSGNGALRVSHDASLIGVLDEQRLWIIGSADGVVKADFDLGEVHNDLAFSAENQIYLAGESGALKIVSADRTGNWNLRELWRGSSPLRNVAVSEGRGLLVIVDAAHKASLFDVQEGSIGTAILQLPDAARDIVFSPSETRLLIRTARWVHRASLSPSGLVWIDALRAPKALPGSHLVLDVDSDGNADPLGNSLVLLTRDTGFAEVAELQFGQNDKPALIGPLQELRREWRSKLAR